MLGSLTTRQTIILATLSASAAIGVKHLYDIHQRIWSIPFGLINETQTAPENFLTSFSVKTHVNPQARPFLVETRTIRMRLVNQDITDDQILASFTRGFFGGKVFATEKKALQLFEFITSKPDSPVAINSLRDPSSPLPPVGTEYFSAFRVSDKSLSSSSSNSKESSESYADFTFGSSKKSFAGVHRFSVLRNGVDLNEVDLRFPSYVCNPSSEKGLNMPILMKFHLFYAKVLFMDGISEVISDGLASMVGK